MDTNIVHQDKKVSRVKYADINTIVHHGKKMSWVKYADINKLEANIDLKDEVSLNSEIAKWLSKLHTVNKEQNGYWVQGMNPLLINMIKSMIRGHYTPKQLKIDIETFMNTEQNPEYWGGERITTCITNTENK